MNFKKSTLAALVAITLGALSFGAEATIVNISATSPTATFASFDAGTYNVAWIGKADGGQYDAWSAALAGTKPVSFRNAFTASSFGITQTFGDFSASPDTAAAALAEAKLHPFTFALPINATISFGVPEIPGFYGDNTGGVSLSITQAVPEPETYALMLAGLGAMAFIGRRRSAKNAA